MLSVGDSALPYILLAFQILPKREDLHRLPEEGPSLRARVIRLLKHHSHTLKSVTGELLFALCLYNRTFSNSDVASNTFILSSQCSASRLVWHIGYGNAAGVLAAHGMFAPPAGVHQDSDAEDDEYDLLASLSIIP